MPLNSQDAVSGAHHESAPCLLTMELDTNQVAFDQTRLFPWASTRSGHDRIGLPVPKMLSDVEAIVRVIEAFNGLSDTQRPAG